jgi:hypothetical protein
MQIIIPTRGRTGQQLTLQSLPGELRKRTTLVCPKREAPGLYRLYGDVVKIVYEPYHNMKIAQKREWIVQECYRGGDDKVLMLDDDLVFSTRKSADDWHLRPISGEELIPEFQLIEDKLGPEYPHVGFGPRQGNRWQEAGWKTPDKMMCSLAYYLPIVVECELSRIETRQDFDLTLQLLRKGYRNAVWHTTVHDQKYDAPGGCNLWRTPESSNADAYELARLHPGYVSVVEKAYEASGPRTEVRCEWQKALDDGHKVRSQSR